MTKETTYLKSEATKAKYAYNIDQMTWEQARIIVKAYVDHANTIIKATAKEFDMEPKCITVNSFMK